jgi:hypothetical protein
LFENVSGYDKNARMNRLTEVEKDTENRECDERQKEKDLDLRFLLIFLLCQLLFSRLNVLLQENLNTSSKSFIAEQDSLI